MRSQIVSYVNVLLIKLSKLIYFEPLNPGELLERHLV